MAVIHYPFMKVGIEKGKEMIDLRENLGTKWAKLANEQINEWVNKTIYVYIHTMEFYLATKRK
jgi:hypothetical protein